MIFEISTLLGNGGKMQTTNGSVDAMLMRTARAAKARSLFLHCSSLVQLAAVASGGCPRWTFVQAHEMLELLFAGQGQEYGHVHLSRKVAATKVLATTIC